MSTNKKRVLIGSPIHQGPVILQEFLCSLRNIERSEIEIGYFFIDDNDDALSSQILREFAKENENVTLLVSGQKDTYFKNDTTHFWNEHLIWKVAKYKNTIINQAVYEQYDYLFLVDSDLLLHPLTIKQLLAAGKDIVSEIFWTAWQDDSMSQPQVWLRDEYTQHEQGRGEELTYEEASDRYYQFISRMKTPGLYEVGGLGACTLISRRAMDAGVDFSQIKNLSFWGEDRHFCVRAAALGFSLFVDTHFPAYHIYRSPDLNGINHFKDESGYAAKSIHGTIEEPQRDKLTLSMIVKNEGNRYLNQVLEAHKKYIDEAVFIDDGSEDDTVNICLNVLKGIPIHIIRNDTSKFSNEVELRKQQWEETVNTNPEWILNLDADEMFESQFSQYIELLLQHEGIDLYCFRLYDMWDDAHYREDSLWFAHQIYRPFLVRYRPDFECEWKETAQHCGRFPENIFKLSHSLSTLRVKHFGWAKYEDRLNKYERYMKLDPNAHFGMEAQYDSILDKDPNLIRWIE
ncbi:glycosyltransferase family 2 protein [Cytobacillus purgationiresistens]|uniref:Glycosyltransferase involved in cell wall biosynthesis n=1 Tax=Cytobacillus purgationiresistens TaxID=863449 RepID=A0ABU0AH67_9BACI|nr:glycosyltransferase family 2 protein [Cytobacillus purgationiresistens]MDQ0270597.1 glycosyltransferase involved in cell wall biosynthesis [Cytobacillus purgationiresistens]